MPITEAKVHSCICPSCGTIDPETEYYQPLWARDPETGAWETSGYRCAECGEISESDDWQRLAAHICSKCGAYGNHACPADLDAMHEALPLWAGEQVCNAPPIPMRAQQCSELSGSGSADHAGTLSSSVGPGINPETGCTAAEMKEEEIEICEKEKRVMTQKRDVVKFAPNAPVEVALKYSLPGKIISTQNGERVMYTLIDNRVMFLDLSIAKKVEDLGVNVREKFFICRPSLSTKGAEWNVWRSPEPEEPSAEAKPTQTQQQEFSLEQESPLERKLRESIELVKQGKLGELGNGTFAVPAGASAATPAPVESDAVNGHRTTNNGHRNINGKDLSGNGNRRSKEPGLVPWAEYLLDQADALIGVYAAALNNASTKFGNQVKPEDVRSLLVTVFIQRSKGGPNGA
jgi:hypothetical protein